MPRGTIETFKASEGWGELEQAIIGDRLRFHETAVRNEPGTKLAPGQVVYFEILEGKHGRQAVDIRVVTSKGPSNRTP